MGKAIQSVLIVFILTSTIVFSEDEIIDLQEQKERTLVYSLKKLVTCKNIGGNVESDLNCAITFRGLHIDFAGVNRKGGGTLYVTSLGKNQTLQTRGSRCIVVAFDDEDLRGTDPAHIIFRDDGVITYNHGNKKAWEECR